MAHFINRAWHMNKLLRPTQPIPYEDLQMWNTAIKNNAMQPMKKKEPLCINLFQQALFMSQVQNIIANVNTCHRERILAALNPESGSLRMGETLKTNSFWDELSQTYNLPPFLIAQSSASTLLGINAKFCFQTIPCSTGQFPPFRHKLLRDERTIISKFYYGNDKFIKQGEDKLIDYNGEIRGIVSRYTNGATNLFFFQGRVSLIGEDYICTGRTPLPNYPFGHERLYQLPTLPCLVFAIPDVGFEFRQIYLETGNIAASKFHALTFYEDIRKMNLIELSGRDIILLISPDRVEWDNLEEVLRLLHESYVKSVSIYPYPIISEYCKFENRAISHQSHELLTRKIIDLREWERITKLADHIISQAIPEEDFENFRKRYKLDKDTYRGDSSNEIIEFLPWRELNGGDIEVGGQITTRMFFNAANTTLIYGESDAGKSWFTLQIVIALATGQGVFGLTASPPVKVLYLDGEIGCAFAPRVQQLAKNLDQDEMALLNENLKVRTLVNSQELLERPDEILAVLEKEKAKVLIIDNLLSLAPQSWRGKSEQFFDFLRQIKSMGIAPIINHHTDKSGETYLGSVSISSLSQNIIRLTKARDFLRESEKHQKLEPKELNNVFSEAETGKGPFVRMCLEKTKIAPYWLNESIYLCLPVGGTWQQLSNWPDPDKNSKSPSGRISEFSPELKDKIIDLPPDEKKAMEYIISNRGGVKREDIDRACSCKEAKSQKILKFLLEKNLIFKVGEGKSIIYKPNL